MCVEVIRIKSCLMGVRVEGDSLNLWAKVLNCVVGEIPFVYLGLPIGAKARDKKGVGECGGSGEETVGKVGK